MASFWEDGDADTNRALQRYRTLVETVGDGLFQLDPSGRFVGVNDAFAATTGYDREELVGSHVSRLFDDTEIERIERSVQRQLEARGGTEWMADDMGADADAVPDTERPFDVTLETASGECLLHELRVNTFIEDGDVRGVVGVVREVASRDQGRNRGTDRSQGHAQEQTTTEKTVGDRELETREAALRESYEVIADGDRSFEEQVEALLEIMREVLGTSYATFSRVEGDEYHFEVVHTPDEDERVQAGDVVVLSATNCERTVTTERTLVREDDATDVPDLAGREDDAQLEISCYIGAPVFFDGDVYGTFCFYDPEPREVPFSDWEVTLVELLSRWVGDELERLTRETELRRTTVRLETIFENSNDAIFVSDPDADEFVDVNPAACEMLGYDADELLELGPSDVHPDDADAFRAVARLVREEETGSTDELTYRTTDGRELTSEVSTSAVEFDDRELLLSIVRDVSDRKAMEATLREHERQLSRLMDNIPGMVYRCRNERGWPMEFVSEACRDVTGFEPDALEDDEVRYGEDIVLEEDRDELWESIQRDVTDGEPFSESYRIETADGEIRWVRDYGRGIFDEDGELVALEGIIADVTERKRLEAELDEIFGRITDAFYALDDQWRFTLVNDRAAELIDVTGEGLVGKNIWDVFDWAVGSKLEVEYRQAMENQEPTSFERYVPEPLETWFEVNVYPSATGLSVYFRDVTERKERERDLELFRNLLDRSSDAVFVIDPAMGEILDVNGTATRHLGYSRGELLDLTVPDIDTELPTQRAWESFVEDLKAEGQTTFHGIHRRKDGTTFPVEINVSYVELDREYVLSVSRDVTERKRRERQLRESEQRHRTLAEHFPNGMVTLFDDEFRYTLAAGQGFDDIPLDPDDLEGSLFRDVWDDRIADALEPAFEAALDGEERSVELEYARREWIVHAVPIVDEEGDVFAGMTMSQDVTERKKYRRRLEESEYRYRSLAENFPNGGVGVFDRDLRYTLVTGTMWDDVDPDAADLEGKTIWNALPSKTATDIEPLFRAALDGETDRVVTTLSGRIYVVWATPLYDAEGEITAGQSFALDVTDRIKRERQLVKTVDKLEESNRRLEQFAYAASHDLQEPLRMVSSYLQLLETRYGDALDEDGEEFLEFAVDGAERMRDMIDGLLEYSRVETRGESPEPIDLDDVFETVCEDLTVQIDESNASVTADSLPRVRGDTDQVRQVFQNLLTNAITYSGDEPPRVHVSAERDGQNWIVSVRDEGIGIDPGEQERVFDVFHRLHSRERYSGTGIGLALCERIVERHGGEIWVDSEPDEGATFSFTLPAADEE